MAKPLRPELFYMDTSAMIALLVRDDPEHERALGFFKDAVREGSVFVIGRPTLMEFLNGVAKHVGKDVAEEQYRLYTASRFIFIEKETEADWERAWELFFKYRDQQGIDLFDSLAFAIMERLGIRKAFTFDSDFAVHGFVMVP
ncbi:MULTISPECIES: type II toxin-antitoxin system VapC family toxin [Thermococcus]|uniref:Ribonuclease VapC n=1 Tax=Thermococcus nautili TaxID=195522 RepID=W8P5S3_9EURY|nr:MULTISPECIES: type II toxin-antitoxin system VapC family toxin [Thermococcus]AHL22845.1 putative nucleic acid-binding protein, contains PIN domain [Thermococcus nautili]NJE50029.1 PIN domain-containing protein [Thermococcus sp. 9N3]